jgi:hypothetical protein
MTSVPPSDTSRAAFDAFVDALHGPARPHELAGAEDIVARMAAVIADTPAASIQESTPMKSRLPRFAAFTAAGVLSLGGVAAAATGTNLLKPVLDAGGAPAFPRASTTTVVTTTTTARPTTTTVVVTSAASDLTTTTVLPEGTSTSVPLPPGVDPNLCETARNHGEAVSTVAKDSSTTGAEHGAAVSAVAQSDCGKNKTEDENAGTESDSSTASDQESEVEDQDERSSSLTPSAKGNNSQGNNGQGNNGQGKGKNK